LVRKPLARGGPWRGCIDLGNARGGWALFFDPRATGAGRRLASLGRVRDVRGVPYTTLTIHYTHNTPYTILTIHCTHHTPYTILTKVCRLVVEAGGTVIVPEGTALLRSAHFLDDLLELHGTKIHC
jgi:hypothetical protein